MGASDFRSCKCGALATYFSLVRGPALREYVCARPRGRDFCFTYRQETPSTQARQTALQLQKVGNNRNRGVGIVTL